MQSDVQRVRRHLSNAQERIELARQALAADSYFSEDEIGDDIAPRITERLAQHRDETQGYKQRLEAVGQLHKRVEHPGQTICAHCSDNRGPGREPIGWPCDTIKAATGYTGDTTAAASDG
jgi:hypothetical protein